MRTDASEDDTIDDERTKDKDAQTREQGVMKMKRGREVQWCDNASVGRWTYALRTRTNRRA